MEDLMKYNKNASNSLFSESIVLDADYAKVLVIQN